MIVLACGELWGDCAWDVCGRVLESELLSAWVLPLESAQVVTSQKNTNMDPPR